MKSSVLFESLVLLHQQDANNESSEVDILLPVTFHFNPSTRLDNVKNLRRFVISQQDDHVPPVVYKRFNNESELT